MSVPQDSLDFFDVVLLLFLLVYIIGGWSKFESGLFDLCEVDVLEVRQAFWTAARP